MSIVLSLRLSSASIVMFVILVLLLSLPLAYSDRGGWPLGGLSQRVSESGQKAIIAWNGTQEILMLSTDVSSTIESEVMEIMPLPSNPTITKGEKQPFSEVIALVNTYLSVVSSGRFGGGGNTWGGGGGGSSAPKIKITFQQMIGIHYLTVVEAEEANELILWLENFLEAQGYEKELPSNLADLLAYYTNNGMKFFVIDLIEVDSTAKSIDPLVYTFRSQNLYYPLRISTLFSGDTEISLFTITNTALNDNSIIRERFAKRAQFQIRKEILTKINENLTKLFSCDPYLCYYEYSGSLEAFNNDISTNFLPSFSRPVVFSVILISVLGLAFLVLFFPSDKIHFHETSLTTRLETAFLLTGLLGTFLIWLGCFLPWGLVEYHVGYTSVLVTLKGLSLSSGSAVTIVILFFIAMFFLTPWYIYWLIQRDSRNLKETSTLLIMGGAYLMLQLIVSCTYYLYTIDVGTVAIVVGCASIILAGLLSSLRLRLSSTDLTLPTERMGFKRCILRKSVIATIIIMSVALLLFCLWYVYPPWWLNWS